MLAFLCRQLSHTFLFFRPTFSNIVKTLDKLICCPETLRKIATNQNINPFAPDAPDLTQFQSVDEWLATIKMSRYQYMFLFISIYKPVDKLFFEICLS